jgi:hypothetical protein
MGHGPIELTVLLKDMDTSPGDFMISRHQLWDTTGAMAHHFAAIPRVPAFTVANWSHAAAVAF